MKKPKPILNEAAQALARAAEDRLDAKYVLTLYVAGVTKRSRAAIKTVTATCEALLKGRYTLEVVDIYQHPQLAKGQQILAVPTLIKQLPLPLKKVIGDMANEDKVLVGLDLQSKP